MPPCCLFPSPMTSPTPSSIVRVEGINPRIAYLCRLYAFDKARRLDPRSTGRGVHQFKTVLRQRLEKENEATLKHRIKQSDYSELTLFWQKYVEKSKQAIQHCGALVEDLSRLNKEYETTTVLSEVLSRFRQQPSGGKLRKDDIISHKHDLICQWAAQGILPTINRSVQETTFEVTNSYHRKIKFNEDNVYQVGNAILEAFLEYSLLQLPFPYEAKADDPTKSAAHFLAYQGLIAEQLTIGEIWVDQHSRLEHMQWISHMDDQGWQISREWLSHGHRPRGPTTLVVRRCSPSFFAKLGQLLPKLPYLHVLDLSYTQVESLPPSICYLQKLQLLLLKGCHKLANPFSFPITLPGKNITNKVNLLNLDLSYSNVETFDSDFFQNMPSLQELLLVGCSDLVELPPSIVGLSSLTTLKITRTRIKSFHYWEIFNKMKKLLSLELINGIGGWEFGTEEELKLEGHPTLRSFSLVAAPYIRRLSFNGCRKLESVDTLEELDALEELDLSATGIKELPAHIPNLPRLRQLLLIGVPALRRFPWHALKRLPDIVCLDQSLEGNGVHCSPQVAQMVSTSNSRLFYSFFSHSAYLVRSGHFLKSFYIQVKSFKARFMKTNDEDDMVTSNMLQVSESTYADVNHQYLTGGVSMLVSMDDMLPFRVTERHVEISAVDRYPAGLTHLLEVTKSVCMMNDTHVTSLSGHLSNFNDLEECKLRRCHRMVHVFEVATCLGNNLKNACVSYLKSLTHFYRPPYGRGATKFRALKHIRLEHCPRLEGFMPCDCELPSLVTLDILFCYNLKAIFYNNGHHSSPRHYQFPCLQKIRLQELPLLEHLYVNDAILTAPKWEEFQVRGCWSLHRLPRLHQQPNKTVKVSGEQAWWAKLHWDDDQGDNTPHHRSLYEPSLPPAFTFVREHFVIKSYLR
ncbi:hypothetical protein BDA96_02G211000 [Sorghum bicolor]|uniref:Disease resistance protein At4g27190-like leucine-rich repeats domain-containing protein n=1 Tax=Sorghum bicolor TaxID=4558 RepID=A0A921RQ75_SORBI|nr:hypothetical protein BDA96_02G211000 [Sorghum bicolor]